MSALEIFDNDVIRVQFPCFGGFPSMGSTQIVDIA